ncbi:MAG: UDP-N-acetylglucosamine 1-carboxyvinyltransferase [Elusimicrobia bacterium]|nr:UDP-N-acetylglucosamine 1-carboxyvinyltransferase [Elusimicrobiota bacterium]
MDAYKIDGGFALRGSVEISGSKNASLPCLFASLLTPEPVRIRRLPVLRDTNTALSLLKTLGKEAFKGGDVVCLEEKNFSRAVFREITAPYDLVKQMRASILSAGPMLARWGKARVSLPGGCAIGLRPIDIHLDGFKAMGAKISVHGGDLELTAPKTGLKAARYRLHFESVGATENLMMAAAFCPGVSVLERAAREPEITDLASMLQNMGAMIEGAGTSRIVIRGNKNLRGTDHAVIADRIETGTFVLFAASAPGSSLEITGCVPEHNRALLDACRKAGVSVETSVQAIRVSTPKGFRPRPLSIKTKVYPGFPTDIQPLWTAFMSRARGRTTVQESIFENRFLHVAELNRMGADIAVRGDRALIRGAGTLTGAKVMAGDLRAGAGLIAAALAAGGQSVISRIYHVDRGYENLEGKLSALGARIKRFVEVRYQRVA